MEKNTLYRPCAGIFNNAVNSLNFFVLKVCIFIDILAGEECSLCIKQNTATKSQETPFIFADVLYAFNCIFAVEYLIIEIAGRLTISTTTVVQWAIIFSRRLTFNLHRELMN